jgi:rhodanese-related sulfurtransferase
VVKTISREELKEKMDRGEDLVLVDALAEMYYRHSHLPGAINLPVDQVTERAPELLPDKAAEIVVYCMDPPCEASEEVARELAAMGYTNVRDYVGGKTDWIDAGLPAEGRYYERRRERNR